MTQDETNEADNPTLSDESPEELMARVLGPGFRPTVKKIEVPNDEDPDGEPMTITLWL